MSESPLDPAQVAIDAYVYLYPLITLEYTRRQSTNVEAGQLSGRAPMGQFAHIRAFPDADWKVVVRPNFDTLYSLAFLDLSAGPVIVSVPDTDGRYYLLPILDMWSDVFAVPGWRTRGTSAARYALTAPGWSGELPDGVEQLAAPTSTVWIIGRTQTNGPDDYAAVNAIQDGITAEPLSGAVAPFTADPSIDMSTPPLVQVEALSGADYFALGAELLKIHPPHATDYSLLARAERIGLIAGQSFGPAGLDSAVTAAVAAAPQAAQTLLRASLPHMGVIANGWTVNTDTMGVYGNYYLKRAVVAQVGLGANPPEDAIYPVALADVDGQPISGEHDYVLLFDAARIPPVDAFWSLTMYDAEGFQIANPLNRFAIGDRDPITYAADGSLDLYIQQTSPGAGKEANWLPSGPGPLGLTLRLYAPRPEVLNGQWVPEPITRVN